MAQHVGAIPWNKGLTKEDPRVMAYTKPKIGRKMSLEQRVLLSTIHMGKKLSDSHKKAISEAVKKNLPSTAWGKGQHISVGTEFKKGEYVNELNRNWKGDEVGYFALHNWVARKLGKPSKCTHCGDTTKRKYEWANISGEYKRDLSDWVRLCVPCHKVFDGQRRVN